MHIIKKYFQPFLGSKTQFLALLSFESKIDYKVSKLMILTPKMVNNIFDITCIFTAAKDHQVTPQTSLLAIRTREDTP